MMKIKIYCIGKLKEKFFLDAQNEYLKRIKRFAKIDIIEIPDVSIPEKASPKELDMIKEKEFENLISKIEKNTYVIALDLDGKEYDSIQLSKKLDSLMTNSNSNIAFLIGGSLGFPRKVNEISNEKLKLSNLTFTHIMSRVILLEQLYRCFKILNNETYQK